jgi:DNA-binding response OmpR family regulator
MSSSHTNASMAASARTAGALRVALVEDDDELREEILKPQLIDAGIDVVSMRCAADLYRAMRVGTFDIVVLDIGLPDESGFDVARHLRTESSVGIVMLTGRKADADRVRGLNVGADAFLPKPVDSSLLIATLHSLSRRLRGAQPRGPARPAWSLDRNGWHLRSPAGQDVELTASERLVLQRLFAADSHPVSRNELIAVLASDGEDFDPHRLEVLVHRLRRKVSASTATTLPLRAIRGSGYLLTIDERYTDRPFIN